MRSVFASAPGKIMLCGEYAVLAGAPAIVTAVDCRARVVLEEVQGPEHVLLAPGMANDSVRFLREASGGYTWSAGRYRLVESILDALPAMPVPALSIQLDTRTFRDPQTGRKLGLGSSAALAMALAAALDAILGAALDVYGVAASAHRSYQRGSGSGADIAASYAGGTIRFRRPGARQDLAPQIQPLPWPAGLEYRVLWSGRPVNTARKLRKLDGRKGMEHKSADALAASAKTVSHVWETSSADAVMDALRTFTADLRRFSDEQDIGIFAAGHEALVEAAAALGLVYKPCGAGGGDIGMVFGTRSSAMNTFCDHATAAGFSRLNVSVAADGVSIEKRTDA